MRKKITAILITLGTVLLMGLLETKFQNIPVIGDFINPHTGFWQNMEPVNMQRNESRAMPELAKKVTVKYDDSRIPHIIAASEHDLYFMQGYLTAKDRLWQMDIQVRKAAGRLSEILGKRSVSSDLYYRKIGLAYAAENSMVKMMKDSQLRTMLLAYSAGVNAYISKLKPMDYPLEFKLLSYRPERWQPVNTALLLKLLTETLTGGSDDMAMSHTLTALGTKKMADLYPDEDFRKEPIIPANTAWGFKSFTTTAAALKKAEVTGGNFEGKPKERVEGIGSNNWVVTGTKTQKGFPILANDPHLDLTYPSIWYQIQLNGPGVNVYGVSVPGIPCILSGFNTNISWGVTNVDADVLDWYRETFRNHNSEYLFDNNWKPVTKRVERILVRNGRTVLDTVIYTGHGPVVYSEQEKKPARLHQALTVPNGFSLKWIGHESSVDLKTFYLLNRATNYADYRRALTFYTAPAQNFIFASKSNDIAITVDGKFPVKEKDQGKFLLDGTTSKNDWHGWIPDNEVPSVLNPTRGFLSSANQSPTDKSYPYYLNWQFAPPERAIRINRKLETMQGITIDSMINLQNDDYSILAEEVLPIMLNMVDQRKLNATQRTEFKLINTWDKCYNANSVGATIFNAFWNEFYHDIWANKFSGKTFVKYPSRDRTVKLLLTDEKSSWFDDLQTPANESCKDIVNRAFFGCLDSLTKKMGSKPAHWEWGISRPIFIKHLAGFDGMGSGKLKLGGSVSTINALASGHGPSWRMVVEMGKKINAYGILPGGESGNPGSFYYDNLLNDWKKGKLKHLVFLSGSNDQPYDIKSTSTYLN